MRTARTLSAPLAVLAAAVATAGLAAPEAMAQGGALPRVIRDGGVGVGPTPGPGVPGAVPGVPGVGPGGVPGVVPGVPGFGPGAPGVGAGGVPGVVPGVPAAPGVGPGPGGVPGVVPGVPGFGPGVPGVGPGNGPGHGGFGGEGRGRGPGGGFGDDRGGHGPGGGFGNGRGDGWGGDGFDGGPGFDPDFGPGGGPGGWGDGHGHGPAGIRNIVAAPGVIARGGQLAVTVEGCRNGGVVESRAFARTPLRPVNAFGDRARAIATIREDVHPGTYDITAECGGQRLIRPRAFTVIGGVRGGIGGGTVTGATPADMAIGGGLLAAGTIGGGVFWLRRRRAVRRV